MARRANYLGFNCTFAPGSLVHSSKNHLFTCVSIPSGHIYLDILLFFGILVSQCLDFRGPPTSEVPQDMHLFVLDTVTTLIRSLDDYQWDGKRDLRLALV